MSSGNGAGGGGADGGGAGSDAAPQCDEQAIRDQVIKASPCYAGNIGFGPPPFATLYLGYLTQLSFCSSAGPSAIQAEEAIRKPALAVIEAATCSPPPPGYLFVGGPLESQGAEMWNALQAACPAAGMLPRPPFKITVDANGKVASVTPDPTSPMPQTLPQDLIDCMMMALSGHTFSCLGNMEICPGTGGDP